MRIVAIGDIHGERRQLESVLAHVQSKWDNDVKFVFLGDLIDRGPDSAGVLKIVNALVQQGHHAIMGNHEEVFMAYMAEKSSDWLSRAFGPQATLNSFQRDWERGPIGSPTEISLYIQAKGLFGLFAAFQPFMLLDGLALTHAPVPERGWDGLIPDPHMSRWGAPPRKDVEHDRYVDGLWAPAGYFAVCGHIPTPKGPKGRKPYLIGDRGLYLDCGCGTIPGTRLHAAVFEDGKLVNFVTPEGIEEVYKLGP